MKAIGHNKESIIEYLKNEPCPDTLDNKLYSILVNDDPEDVKRFIFFDPRSDMNSLRLTNNGALVLRTYFEWHEFTEFTYNYSLIKFFNKNTSMPWFLNEKVCYLFDSDMAFNWYVAEEFELFSKMYEKGD